MHVIKIWILLWSKMDFKLPSYRHLTKNKPQSKQNLQSTYSKNIFVGRIENESFFLRSKCMKCSKNRVQSDYRHAILESFFQTLSYLLVTYLIFWVHFLLWFKNQKACTNHSINSLIHSLFYSQQIHLDCCSLRWWCLPPRSCYWSSWNQRSRQQDHRCL